MDKAIETSLTTIETLKEQIQELIKKKGEIVNEINKPIYEAKEKAEKLVSEAEAKAKELIDNAESIKSKREAEIQELDENLSKNSAGITAKLNKFTADKQELDKQITDFNSSKYAFETNIKSQKIEADNALAKAIQLQTELSNVKVTLDHRESNVNRKTDELQKAILKLEKVSSGSQEKIVELRTQEQSLIDQKAELLAIKSGNEQLLSDVKKERESSIKDKEENLKVLEEIKRTKEGAEKTKEANTAQLQNIANERAELIEQQKSLREKERLQKLLERQVNDKINTLNKLRKEE